MNRTAATDLHQQSNGFHDPEEVPDSERALFNFYNLNPQLIAVKGDENDPNSLTGRVKAALTENGMGDHTRFVKQFEPTGVSGIYLTDKGHVAFHTWDEHGLAEVDACGDGCEGIMKSLQRLLPGTHIPVIKNWFADQYRKVGCHQVVDFASVPISSSPRQKKDIYLAPGTSVEDEEIRKIAGYLMNLPPTDFLLSTGGILEVLYQIADAAGFHTMGDVSRESPNFTSAYVGLQESHMGLRRNKQTGEVVADIFTCGKEGNPGLGAQLLEKTLGREPYRKILYHR